MNPRISKRNLHTLDLVDSISELPDSILGLILSYLPTKNAVATSILSKRWKSVWMTIHNLEFCYVNDLPEEEDMKFVRFVNNVLLLHDVGSLNKLCLVWIPRCNHALVSSLISFAITRNVHEIYLCVEYQRGRLIPGYLCYRNIYHVPLELPISLFNCDSLKSLELNELKGYICVSTGIVVCLPRLETLKLGSVYFRSEEAFVKLICGCPMLNYLNLDIDMDDLVKYFGREAKFTYTISSTSLRRLDLLVGYPESWFFVNLELEASSLEYLKLVGFISKVSVQGTLSSLVEADFTIRNFGNEFSEDTCNSVVEAVRAFDCAKSLTISMEVMQAISNATICLSTKFKRLTKLKAEAIYCSLRDFNHACSALGDFIQSSDSLQVLTIEQDFLNQDDLDEDQLDSKWIAPIEVPRCLSNSLKEVSFNGYVGLNDEREMIGYMLKYGSALEVMRVTCDTWKRKELELVKEICSFPRTSWACKVHFM